MKAAIVTPATSRGRKPRPKAGTKRAARPSPAPLSAETKLASKRDRGFEKPRPTKISKIRAQPGQITNQQLAELLALEAENARPLVQKAMRRAARMSFIWPEEAAVVVAAGRSLTEFPAVGPFLEKIIEGWVRNPPLVPPSPPIRQQFLTLPQAREILRARPAWAKGLRGDLQMHTEWSDGSGTVQEMAAAGVALGHEYIAITDHTKGLKIAGGINENELSQQRKEIDETNQEYANAAKNFRVLHSAEVNINPRGEGDMEPSALESLDVVLGSFHSALRTTEDQTPRYLAALRNRHLRILGHPRGRIFNYRLGLAADWPRVFATAAELDKAIEIDSYPDRQDLNIDLLRLARREGVRISIGTDAHHPWQLMFIELGLAAACEAGIPRERILNFLPVDELLAWAKAA